MPPRPAPRRTRADLLARTALCGATAGAVGLLGASQAQAAGGGGAVITGLPVQASTTPQVAGGQAGQPTVSVAQPNGTGAATMTVATNASRTLIDWNSFTVAQGNTVNFTFNGRGDIALNRMVDSTPVMINGVLNGTITSTGAIGGNVWFSAPGGIVFGSTAVVNVGGLLATTALVDTASFLNPNTSTFPFTYPGTGYPAATGYPAGTYSNGSGYPAGMTYAAVAGYPTSGAAGGVGGVTVQAGAQLTAQGGLLALIAPFVNVASNTNSVTKLTSADETSNNEGAGSVLYGAANAFTVSLSQETSGDLDMLQFVIDAPSQVTDTPLLLQGVTRGTNVYVASLTASGITGAVVNASGSLNANTAENGQGGEIILSTSADTINAPSVVNGPGGATFQPGGVANQQNLSTSPSDLQLTSATAEEDIQAYVSGTLTVGGITGEIAVSGAAAVNLTAGALQATAGTIIGYGGLTATATTGDLNAQELDSPNGDVTAKATLGSINLANTTANNVYVTAAQTAYVQNATSQSNVSDPIDVTGANAELDTGNSQDNINVIATNGYAKAGDLTALGAVTVQATNGLASLHSATLSQSTTGYPTTSAYPNTVSVSATGTNADVLIGDPAGTATVTGFVTGATSITATADRDVTVNVDQAIELSQVSAGRNVSLTAPGLTLDSLQGALTGTLAIDVTDAAFTYTSPITTQGSATLSASGALQLGNVAASGGAIALSGAGVSAGALNAGGDVSVSAITTDTNGNTFGTGAISLTTVGAGGSATLQGSSVTATSVSAGPSGTAGSITANAYETSNYRNAGQAFVDIGSATASGDIALNAGFGYASLGSATFTGSGQTLNLTAQGGTAYLGYGPGGPSANGGAGPTAGAGSVSGSGTVNITAGTDADLNVAPGSGLVTLGTVNAQDTVNLTADALTLTGTASGSSGVNLTTRTGDTNAQELDSGFGDVTVNAMLGSVYLANTTAQNVFVTAAQIAHVDNATSQTQVGDPIDVTGATAYLGTGNSQDDINVTATNGNATAGALTAYGAITIKAANGVASLASATGGPNEDTGAVSPITVSVSATGTNADAVIGAAAGAAPAGFVTGATSITVSAARDVTVNVAQSSGQPNIELNEVSAGRNVSLTAPSLTLDTLQGALAGDLDIDVTAAGFSYTNTIAMGGGASVSATGALTLGPVSAYGGDLTLSGAGVSAGALNAGGNVAVSAIGTDMYGDTFGTGAISLTTVGAGGSATLQGSSVTATSVSAGASGTAAGSITADAYETSDYSNAGQAFVDIGSATASGDITLNAGYGYASLGSVTFGGGLFVPKFLNLTAQGGTAYLGYGPGGPSANGGAGPTVAVGSVTGPGTVNITAGADADLDVAPGSGTVALGTVSAQNTVNLTADALTLTGTASGGSGVNVTARTGDINAATLSSYAGDIDANANQGSIYLASASGANVYVTAAQTAHVDSATSQAPVSDPINVTGASAYLGTGNSQDDINVTATNGNATAGDLTALGAITIKAANGLASLHSATLSPSSTGYPNTVSVSASGTNADVLIGDPAGTATVTGFVTGATSITATADRDVAVNVDQAIELNEVSAGRNVSLTAPSLTLDSLQGTLTGTLAIDVTDAGFSYADALDAQQGVTISATGALQLGNVGGAASNVLLSGAGISAGTVTASNYVTLQSPTGDVTLSGPATAQTQTLQIDARNLNAGTLTAGAGIDLNATGSIAVTDVAAGSLSAGMGSIDIRAGLESATSAQPNAAASVMVNSLTAGQAILVSAPDTVQVGRIATGSSPVYVTIAGESTGPIEDPDASVYTSPDPASIQLGSASVTGGITLRGGAVTSGELDVNGFIDLTADSGAVTLTGPVTAAFGPSSIGGGNGGITVTGQSLSARALTGAAGVQVAVTGSISATDVTAGSAGSGEIDFRAGLAEAAGSQPNAAASITLNSATAGGGVLLTAPNTVQVGSVTASTGDIDIEGAQTGPVQTPYVNSYTAPAPMQVTLGPLSAGGAVFVQARNQVTVNGSATSGANLTLSSGGGLNVSGGLTSGGDTSLQVAAALTLGAPVMAGGLFSASAGSGAISMGDVSAGGGLSVASGGSLTAGALSSGGAVSLQAQGAINLQGPASAAGSFYAGAVSNGSGLGAITVGDVTAGASVDLEGTSVTAGALTGGGTSSFQDLSGQTVTYSVLAHAYPSATNGGPTFLQIGSIDAAGNALLYAAPDGPITVGDVTAAGGVDLEGVGITTGALSAGGEVTSLQAADGQQVPVSVIAHSYAPVSAGAGSSFLQIASVDAAAGAFLTTDAAASVAVGPVTAGGLILVGGGSVRTGALSTTGQDGSGASIQVNSSAGDLDVASVSAPGAVSLAAQAGYASLTSAAFTQPGGSLSITTQSQGQPIYVGYAQGGQSAGGGSGAITGAPTVELTSGGAVAVDVSGALGLDRVQAAGAIGVTASGPVSVNAAATPDAAIQIAGTGVTLDRGASDGPITISAGDGAAAVGDLQFGGGAVRISAANGAASLHSASLDTAAAAQGAPGSISLTASGADGDVAVGGQGAAGQSAGLGFVSGAASLILQADRDVTVDVQGPLALTSAQAGRNASVSADALTLGSLTAGRDVSLTTPNGASGSSGVSATLSANSLSAGEDLTIVAGGALTVGAMSAGRNLSITAPSVSLASLSGQPSGSIFIDATASGFTDGSALSANGGVTAIAAGSLSLGDVNGGQGAVTLTGASVAAGQVSAGASVQATAQSGPLQLASVAAGDGVTAAAAGALSLDDVNGGTGPVTLTGATINAGQVNAGASVQATARTGPLQLGPVIAGGDVTTISAGTMSLEDVRSSDGAVTLTGLSVTAGQVNAGAALQATAQNGVLQLGPVTAGSGVTAVAAGTLSLGDVNGGQGAVSLTGASVAAGQVGAGTSVQATAGSGALQLGAVTANGGGVGLTGASVTTGAISATGAVNLAATSGQLSAASIVTPSGATLDGAGVNLGAGQVGGDLTLVSTGAAGLSSVTVGGALALDAVGTVSIGSLAAGGAGRVVSGGLDVATLLSAPTLALEARNGALTVGGATAPTDGSMWISGAEFGRLHASTSLALYAGSATGAARGALTISDLSLDPSVTPKVSFYAAPGQTVAVTGAVAPTVSGGTVAIGSTTDAAWTPSTILVSGALGAATRVSDQSFTGVRAFQQVTLSSGGDVLIGSPRFFALIQAIPASAIDIARNQPGGAAATGSEIGKVYVAAGQLDLFAPGKVVQQNSSGVAGQYAGVYLLNGAAASKTALSIDPPSVVDLFGSYVDSSGVLTSGSEASRGTGLQVVGFSGLLTPADYRFNGCTISAFAVCGVSDQQEAAFELLAQEYAGVAAATTDPKLLTQSVLLTISPALEIEEEADPLVTGVGNEEIWRKRDTGGEPDQ